jgi:hypothetical protein
MTRSSSSAAPNSSFKPCPYLGPKLLTPLPLFARIRFQTTITRSLSFSLSLAPQDQHPASPREGFRGSDPIFSIAEAKEQERPPSFLIRTFPSSKEILEYVVCEIIGTARHRPHPETVTTPVVALLPVAFEGARVVEDVVVFFLLFLQSS